MDIRLCKTNNFELKIIFNHFMNITALIKEKILFEIIPMSVIDNFFLFIFAK